MKTKPASNFLYHFTLICIAINLAGCDFYKPQKNFKFAVSKNDFLYNSMYTHLKPFLEQNGYEVSVVYADRNVDANRLVAEGKADLAFVNNVSSHIVDELGQASEQLRTVLPLTERALLGFSRTAFTGPQSVHEVFENKTVGIEILHGESHGNIIHMLARAHVDSVKFVQSNQSAYDVRLIWGSLYSKREADILDAGWHPISFNDEWIDFQSMSDPALVPVTLPAMPGDPHSKNGTYTLDYGGAGHQ